MSSLESMRKKDSYFSQLSFGEWQLKAHIEVYPLALDIFPTWFYRLYQSEFGQENGTTRGISSRKESNTEDQRPHAKPLRGRGE